MNGKKFKKGFSFISLKGKHMKKNNIKIPYVRYMAYMLIVMLTVTSASLSRFKMSSSAGDSARVAEFNVSVTHAAGWSAGEFNDIVATGIGGSKDYIFTVTNNSEVAVRARLVVESSSGQAAAVNPSGWFDLQCNNSRNVTVNVVGDAGGNNVKMHVEYEQID